VSIQLSSAKHTGSEVELTWSDNSQHSFHAIWLRDHCRCEQCRNPQNGQRYLDVSELDNNLTIDSATVSAQGELLLSFLPEQHQTRYSGEALLNTLQAVEHQNHSRCEQSKTLWDAEQIERHNTHFDWASYSDDQATQLAALKCFEKFGYFIITDSPAEEGQVLKIVDSFGFVRNTNYGQLFEVRATLDANNLAYTNIGLGQHTDNPYREPVPTIQALHCVENSVDGGESLLLDGFMAADMLRRESPEHFKTLSESALNFRFSDAEADLQARVKMIETDELGRVCCVRYNNRSIDTINLPQAQIPAFYTAYRHFAQILHRSELATQFKLIAGDCMVFDNTRVMHARSRFSTGGKRHLQGAYSDLDGLYSRLRILQRQTQ